MNRTWEIVLYFEALKGKDITKGMENLMQDHSYPETVRGAEVDDLTFDQTDSSNPSHVREAAVCRVVQVAHQGEQQVWPSEVSASASGKVF